MGGGIRVFFAPSAHYLVRGGMGEGEPPKELRSRSARRFWRHYNLTDSDGCAYALQAGLLVGFFRFSECLSSKGERCLMANGTWVHPAFRNKGLGTRLWEKVIARKGPYLDVISVPTETKAGAWLVRSVQSRHETLCWVTYGVDVGPRKAVVIDVERRVG